MNIGIIKFSIRIPGNQSLKGKRRVVSSLCQKLRNNFELSVAEVAHNDELKMATIGVAIVSNSSKIIQQIIAQVLTYLQENALDFILQDFDQEIISGY